MLALVFFLLGLGVGAFCYYRAARHGAEDSDGAGAGSLSEGTLAMLKALEAPVEVRFYSLLDPTSTSESLQAFAGRVDQLLSEYKRQAADRITLTRHTSPSDAAANAAAADGIKPFNLDKGDACFLGIAVAQGDRKESLPRLDPQWEPAVESDLTRAILRVTSARPPPRLSVDTSPPDPGAIEEVRRALPDLASLSVEDGTRLLRETALKEFQATAKDMASQVAAAERRLLQAQQARSESDQQAAMKQIEEIQMEQTEKLKQITARLQAQIAALETLKGVSSQPTPVRK